MRTTAFLVAPILLLILPSESVSLVTRAQSNCKLYRCPNGFKKREMVHPQTAVCIDKLDGPHSCLKKCCNPARLPAQQAARPYSVHPMPMSQQAARPYSIHPMPMSQQAAIPYSNFYYEEEEIESMESMPSQQAVKNTASNVMEQQPQGNAVLKALEEANKEQQPQGNAVLKALEEANKPEVSGMESINSNEEEMKSNNEPSEMFAAADPQDWGFHDHATMNPSDWDRVTTVWETNPAVWENIKEFLDGESNENAKTLMEKYGFGRIMKVIKQTLGGNAGNDLGNAFEKAMQSTRIGGAAATIELRMQILNWASQVDQVFPQGVIHRLSMGQKASLSFTRKQIVVLMSAMVMGLFPDQPDEGFPLGNRPNADMSVMLSGGHKFYTEQCLCLRAYFEAVAKTDAQALEQEKITIHRNVLPSNPISELQMQLPLTEVKVFSNKIQGTNAFPSIEDDVNALQADFANMFIGGGVLHGGNVQEEIRFTVSTELIASMLVTDRMDANEAMILSGAQRFSDYTGYGSGFKFAGVHEDPAPVVNQHRDVHVSAIDAVQFSHTSMNQYEQKHQLREIYKAIAGFQQFPGEPLTDANKLRPVATGNWGSGMFGGDPQLKALLQWGAASVCQRGMNFYGFGDHRVPQKKMEDFVAKLKAQGVKTVKDLWARLEQLKTKRGFGASVWDEILAMGQAQGSASQAQDGNESDEFDFDDF